MAFAWQLAVGSTASVSVFIPLIVMVCAGLVTHLFARRWATEFLQVTVGDIARAVTADGADILALPHDRLTPAQLREILRELVGRYTLPSAAA